MPISPPHTRRGSRAARAVVVALALATVAACSRADDDALSSAERASIADTLRTMIVRAYDLTSPGDRVARMMSLYPSTGPVVSASGGLMSLSRDSLANGVRAFWTYVGQNMRDPRWIWEQFHVDVLGRGAAVVTATYRVPHRTPRGEPHVIGGAMTLVFQRRGGRWVVVQEHLSDRAMEMGAASAAADPAGSGAMPGMSMPDAHAH